MSSALQSKPVRHLVPQVTSIAPVCSPSGVLEGVDCAVASARGVGNAAYTDPAFLTAEREQLFAPTWTAVGVASDVREPGDIKPVDLCGLPLLMTRGRDGAVRVFHNVCSHRGVRLVEQAGNVGRVMICPYHSWTYSLDGKLFSTPHIGGPGKHECDGFDRTRHGLRQVRSAEWLDLVFVNLSADAPAFETHVDSLAERWKHLDPTAFQHGGEDSRWTLDLECNWKLAVENHNDAYHLPWVHPDLNSYSRLEDHYGIIGNAIYSGQGSRAYRPRRAGHMPVLPRQPGLPEDWAERSEYIALFPNAIIGVHADHYWTVWLQPVAANRTLEHMSLYYVGDEVLDDDFREVRAEVHAQWLQIWSEDRGVVERMQRGRSSPAFQGGVFSPALDEPVHHFHLWYARAMHQAGIAGDSGESRLAIAPAVENST